jgi:hypothetical protein
MMGSRSLPVDLTKPVAFINSDATKNGKREGNTILSHRFIPFKAEDKEVLGKATRARINIIHNKGRTIS